MPRTRFFEILLFLIAFLGSGFAEESPDTGSFLKIASWNIRIFSNSRTDDQLRMICRVARQFDFIAIMELRHELVLKRMVNMLRSEFGRAYSYELSPFVGPGVEEEKRGANQELYAFLYDASKIRCLKSGRLYVDSAFFRYPYYATFKSGNFDFTTIVIHVIWGDSVTARRKEVNRMAQVYCQLQDGDPYENDVLLMGDFNCDANDDLAWGPLFSISSMLHLFDLPEKSMIWDTHLYDNILFQSCYVREYTLDRGIVRFDETDFGNNDKAASKAVSDHRPVWGLFRNDGPDDD